MSDPRMTELFTPAQLRELGRCVECGWHAPTQGHNPDCTRADKGSE